MSNPTIKISRTILTVDGKRAGIRIDTGPWIEGVPADQIVIRCKKLTFPEGFQAALSVTNNSDSREDYFEADKIKLLPDHPLYAAARAAAA